MVQEDIEKNICKMRLSADQSIANATITKVNLSIVEIDTNSMADSVNGRLYCRKTGVYEITGHIHWQLNGTGARNVYINKNGTLLTTAGLAVAQAHSVGNNVVPFQFITELMDGDYITVSVFQNSTGALNALGHATDLKTDCVLRLI